MAFVVKLDGLLFIDIKHRMRISQEGLYSSDSIGMFADTVRV